MNAPALALVAVALVGACKSDDRRTPEAPPAAPYRSVGADNAALRDAFNAAAAHVRVVVLLAPT